MAEETQNPRSSSPLPSDDDMPPLKGPALVFGASGAQGRAVIDGLVESQYYRPVYGVTRHIRSDSAKFVSDVLDAQILPCDIADATSVERVLKETKAQYIFFVTTTHLPTQVGSTTGFQQAEDEEYKVIVTFFDTLVKVYKEDQLERHVVFSTLDNVRAINEEFSTGEDEYFIPPLEDGSIVAHYSGKGRGGEYAIQLLDEIDGLSLTTLTLPFLYSNFLAFAVPLPNEGMTQWTISACFGDSAIDMFSVSDLAYIVPEIFDEHSIYRGRNLRISAEKITMDEVAALFSDLFGKDVIYNPLTFEEMASLPIPAAGCMAQMCHFLADKRSSHDIDVTEAIMFPRKPQLFKDWLLINSESRAFEEVGLSVDGRDILSVAVFGATGLQGTSVVKGLLADKRRKYTIRATTRDVNSEKAKELKALDPERIELVQADFDDVASCAAAVEGVDGAFLVTDFFGAAGMDPEVEEQHAKNVIDACEESQSVKHLVFSTLESVEEMNKRFRLGLGDVEDVKGRKMTLPEFDAKARAAAYARTKKLSVTYVLMPCYSEMFFDLLKPEKRVDEETGKEKFVMTVPMKDDTKVMCMSVEDLGPAVANIFDSYQVYAGHEIGLVTDFVSVSEASDIITDVFLNETDANGKSETKEVEKEEVSMNQWIEARGTYMKDLGQMFSYMSHSDAVKKRHSVAKTMKLVPSAKPLRKWIEQNKDNEAFREKLGLR